jgi:hypothetical protein
MLASLLLPIRTCHACACGCGVFEVGDLSMFPRQDQGGMVFLNYNYQDQNRNWSGSSRAPATDNDDRKIETHFITLGLQYMFGGGWGVQLDVPYVFRSFSAVNADTGSVNSTQWGALGDIRLKALYTGLLPDRSLGLYVGTKLPTGDYTHTSSAVDVDRDTQIGTGSTDLLAGGYFHHRLTSDDAWRWFLQAECDLPLFTRKAYCPGMEIDASAGVYYNGWSAGPVKIRPIAQVVGTLRMNDCGASANPGNTGYARILLSPGLEFDVHPVSVTATVEIPVWQRVTGNQIVAPALFKAGVSWMF